MSTPPALPPGLARGMAALARRIRLLRAACGTALLVAVLVWSAAAALLGDFFLDLNPPLRQGLFCTWLGLGTTLFLTALLLPLRRRLGPAALAALVERRYPDLGERLTCAIGLRGPAPAGAGSPVLIALLLRDTEERSGQLDFRAAAAGRPARRLAMLAAVSLLAVLAPGPFWPDAYATLARRFFRPWDVPPAGPLSTLAVTPGDAFAARGRPLSLTARFQPGEDLILPPATALLIADVGGKEIRQVMNPDGAGAFTARWQVGGDFRYRVEAGALVSDWFAVTAIAPVELDAEGATVTVTPPAYAAGLLGPETYRGLGDVAALEHSEVRYDFRFTRPAVAARLAWNTQKIHELPLQEGGRAASCILPARVAGSFHLLLEAEHGITTDYDGGALAIRPDLPPAFVDVTAKEDASVVRADARVSFVVRLHDDVAVTGAELEYRVNGGSARIETVDLEGANTCAAVGRPVFHLAGKVGEGDVVEYRFRARDNLPPEYQGPHTVCWPAEGWRRLRVARRGPSLREQEIVARRDEVHRRLEAVRAGLLSEQRGVSGAREESRRHPERPAEAARQVEPLQTANDANQQALQDLSRFAAADPALAPVAEMSGEVARQEMRQARAALDRARLAGQRPQPRDSALAAAEKQLASALDRLRELEQVNERLSQERLEQARLAELAERQKRLADRAASAAGQPPEGAAPRERAEPLRREQAELVGDLKKLAEQSATLRQALDEDFAEQARQASEQARELARDQRDLAEAARDAERRRAAMPYASVARRQKELAEEAARLEEDTRSAARSAGAELLQLDEVDKAVESLEKGDALTAVQKQRSATLEMDRLSRALEGAQRMAADPRRAARPSARREVAEVLASRQQTERVKDLARRQWDLRLDTIRIQREQAAARPAPQGNPVGDLARRQQAAARAIADLERRLTGPPAQQARRAAEAAQEAYRKVAAGALEQALEAGKQTAGLLHLLGVPARQLAQLQDDLNRQMAELIPDPAIRQVQQQARQADLARQAEELAQALGRLMQEKALPPPVQGALRMATEAAGWAGGSMRQAHEQMQAGAPGKAWPAQEQAVHGLELVAEQAQKAQPSPRPTAPALAGSAPRMGRAVRQARDEMDRALDLLGEGQEAGALAAMRQAAQFLRQAAPDPGGEQPGAPGQLAGNGGSGDGPPLPVASGPDGPGFAGKTWGELSGELRTKIIQDTKARYGDDYARAIKLYFEQIADRAQEPRQP